MQVRFEQLMSCQINQFNREISAKQGMYVDLKQHPTAIHTLPEAKEWPKFGQFIGDLNVRTPFQTTGCMASGNTPGGHKAPFVDVAFADGLRFSEEARSHFKSWLLDLHGRPEAPHLVLEVCDSQVFLPNGIPFLSTRIWFLGDRADAERAFGPIVDLLSHQQPNRLTDAAVAQIPNAKNAIQSHIQHQASAIPTSKAKATWKQRILLWTILTVVALMCICTLIEICRFGFWLLRLGIG
jgi:hypothetical protein